MQAKRRRGTMKVRLNKPGEAPRFKENFVADDCLVCADPARYSGCVGCGRVIPRRAGWCSVDCMNADIISAPRMQKRSEAQTW